MPFTEKAKLIAQAIVHIFETGKAFGEFDAYVVLDDGAGVSYGLSQFTHRSGSLLAVIHRYLELGGTIGRDAFEVRLAILSNGAHPSMITKLAADREFKTALIAAAKTPEMQRAQREIAQSKYFDKAVKACEGSNFVLPMSLAVVYDSINHGSYDLIRDRVSKRRKSFSTDIEFEKAWITEYVGDRDDWLESVPRLRKTDYRTDFFLAQIARGNWNLNLPLNVHGFKLTEKHFVAEVTAENVSEQIDNLAVNPSVNRIANPPNFEPLETEPAQGAKVSDNLNSADKPAPQNQEWKGQDEVRPAENESKQTTSTEKTVEETPTGTHEKTVQENSFQSDKKDLPAPAREGSTQTVVATTAGGFSLLALPAIIWGIVQSAYNQGQIDVKAVFDLLVKFYSENTRYIFYSIFGVIAFLAIKKTLKQVSFMLNMYLNAHPKFHDINIVTAENKAVKPLENSDSEPQTSEG